MKLEIGKHVRIGDFEFEIKSIYEDRDCPQSRIGLDPGPGADQEITMMITPGTNRIKLISPHLNIVSHLFSVSQDVWRANLEHPKEYILMGVNLPKEENDKDERE